MSKKVLIVGGVAGGASTAARLRRMDEEAEIIMFERGADISYANCGLPYYVGGMIEQRKQLLVQTPRAMHSRFNIDVRTMSEVRNIRTADKQVEVANLLDDSTYIESYDYLVLCPGAYPVLPPIPGMDKQNVFVVRNVPDSDAIRQYIESQKPVSAAIVGAGYIGLEMAEMLYECGIQVNLIEASDQILGPLDYDMASFMQEYVEKQGIHLVLADKVVAMEGNERVQKIQLESGTSLPVDLVIIGTGVKPETWLAEQAGLKIGATGGIWVDEYLRTSDPFIYAAGDAIEVKELVTGQESLIPLAGPANRQGWVVANNISGNQKKYSGAQGTSIVKFGKMTAAATGQNEKQLQKKGMTYLVCHAHPFSHATYYPGSTQMSIKLIFTPDDGKVLGAQLVGFDNVDKAADVLATAIRVGLNIYDLQELELAYAPPFSSAKSPVNMVAYVAGNILDEKVDVICWQQVPDLVKAGAFLIDARTEGEFQKLGTVKGAVNIPVDSIRSRLDEIPKDKVICVFCQVGLRSYIANRILAQNGYKVKNISGGYKLYKTLRKCNRIDI